MNNCTKLFICIYIYMIYLRWCCCGVITHPCRFRCTCVWACIAYCIAYFSCADHDDRTGYMDAHGWLITSHRTLWWCGGGVMTNSCIPRHNALGNDSHFNCKTNVQYLIVPHSNNNESHRKAFMSNRESDVQNDIDEVVYFHLQA